MLTLESRCISVMLFNSAVQESLDEIAPVRTFKVRSHHKFGLSDQTKALMKVRDQTRANIHNVHSIIFALI